MNFKPVLLYHGGCPDGFGAALAFWMKHGQEMEYVPVYHKKEPYKGLSEHLLRDREVIMVDIAFDREDTLNVKKIAKKFTVLDHHVSNQKSLSDLDYCHFNMKRSGAVLAWQDCFPDQPAPKLLQYVEDRDLNNCALPYYQEILTAVDAHDRTFEEWLKLSQKMEDPLGFARLLEEGADMLRYNKVLMKIVKEGAYYGEVKGHRVPMINTSFFKSEILNELAEDELFSAGYHFDGENFIFSLRSTDRGLDVSEISALFNGGGHRNAAGFSVKSLDDVK